jgi:hypothetical protein
MNHKKPELNSDTRLEMTERICPSFGTTISAVSGDITPDV